MNGLKSLLLLPLVVSIFSLTSCTQAGETESSVTSPVQTSGTSGSFEDQHLDDVEPLSFTGSAATLHFDPSSQGNYLVVVSSVTQTSENATFQFSKGSPSALALEDDSSDSASTDEEEEDPATSFHQYLGEIGERLRESGVPVPAPSQAALTTSPEVGSSGSFQVLSAMNSITTCKEVNAVLRVATGNLLIYVDKSAQENISDSNLQTLVQNFEKIALPRERALFGAESDINADGKISILMSPVVNQMTATGGLVTGFFFPGDLYQRSSVNPCSNAQEIFYTLVPDSSGKFGTSVSANFAVDNILPGVLAHEYQHMVSFNNHVFKNRGKTEEPWLNECLSHLSEDLTGFGKENPSRVKLFLSQTSKAPLIPAASPNLAERGACYLFLRYLYEQSADQNLFIQRLLNTPLTGVANLEAAFQGKDPSFDQYPEFVGRWSVALSLSGTNVTSDPRYLYRERSIDADTGNFDGICLRCDTQDGRGTILDGPTVTTVSSYPSMTSVRGTATQVYRLEKPTGSVSLSAGTGSEWTGALVRLGRN